MMACIHKHLGLRTQLLCHKQRGAPVGEIGGVKGWLEKFVLDQEAHPGRQSGIDLLERLQQTKATGTQTIPARIACGAGALGWLGVSQGFMPPRLPGGAPLSWEKFLC